jgi:hypothetical protein
LNANEKRRLLISRLPAREGKVYEAASADGDYTLEVKLSVKVRRWLKLIRVISAWKLEFQSPHDSTVAWVQPNTLEVELSSNSGAPRGRVREASFSKISKAIVEDESGRKLGWIDYGFKKDRLVAGSGREIGHVVRLPMKDLPWILSPSKAYLADRFEFVHDLAPDFDDRLIYAWICRKVWQERDSS